MDFGPDRTGTVDTTAMYYRQKLHLLHFGKVGKLSGICRDLHAEGVEEAGAQRRS